jgi:two-component system sensor histidine kinase PhoQ
VFYGDEGDLMELLGNLLDNAYKWCGGNVRVTAQPVSQALHHRTGLVLEIEDDGPGVPTDKLRAVLARGVRADESVPGQGIGLAVAQDIVRAYQGTLDIGVSPLGGARLSIAFPTC